MAAVERLTKQNHDLEEQLRQRDAGHNVQEENQGDSSERGGPERPEGGNDLQETFNTLRSYSMKLNPSKCVFGVTAGKFLGFMVS